jgi:hypothetical protein
MNREDIIKLAQKWGDWNGQTAEFNDVGLVRFAALIAEREREECASMFANEDCLFEGRHIAVAIRARGQA